MSDEIFLYKIYSRAGLNIPSLPSLNLSWQPVCSSLWDKQCPLIFTGQWEGSLKGHPWRGGGSFPKCQGAHCGSGAKANATQQTHLWPGPRSAAHERQHSDGHYLWTHHGPGQTQATYASSARHLSIPALRQVFFCHFLQSPVCFHSSRGVRKNQSH